MSEEQILKANAEVFNYIETDVLELIRLKNKSIQNLIDNTELPEDDINQVHLYYQTLIDSYMSYVTNAAGKHAKSMYEELYNE